MIMISPAQLAERQSIVHNRQNMLHITLQNSEREKEFEHSLCISWHHDHVTDRQLAGTLVVASGASLLIAWSQ